MSSYSYLPGQLTPSEFLASIQLAPLYNNKLLRHDVLADRVLERWVFPTFGNEKGVKTVGHAIEAVNRSLEHLHPRFLPFELKQIIAGYFLTRTWLLCGQVEDGSSSELFPVSLIGSKRFQISTDFRSARYEALTFRIDWIDRLELPPRSEKHVSLPSTLTELSIVFAIEERRGLGKRSEAHAKSLENLLVRSELSPDLSVLSRQLTWSSGARSSKYWEARAIRDSNKPKVKQEYLYTYEDGRVLISLNEPKTRGAKLRLDIVEYLFFEWLETQDPDDLPLMATAKREMEDMAQRLFAEDKITITVLARTIGDHLQTLNFYKNGEWQPHVWRRVQAMRKIKKIDLRNF
ncbi:MAG: hypothetical protein AAFN91_17630 [Pseudomonadota bacterium]